MKAQVYVDTGSAATEHFIALYIFSKINDLPAKEVSPIPAGHTVIFFSRSFTFLMKCITCETYQASCI
jgi:hypothetical protein